MSRWEVMSPHALVGFKFGARAAEFKEELERIPGVRRRGAGWLVPWNAAATVAWASDKYGIETAYARWQRPPPPRTTWLEVERAMRERGEVQDFVLDGFLTQYQKDAVTFGWPRSGVHFWHSTGAGKTLTGLLTSLSIPGPIVVITRAASRLQFAREIKRFTHLMPHVIRPASEKRGLLTVGGKSWVEFFKERIPELGKAKLVAEEWAAQKARHGVLIQKGDDLKGYLDRCSAEDRRPIILTGWAALPSNLARIRSARPAVMIADELHKGKGGKRWDTAPVSVSSEPKEMAKDIRQAEAEARKKGGFVKQTEDGWMMFLPAMNVAAAAAQLARHVAKRIGLTATPVKDRIRDLWAQLDTIEPNAHGPKTRWEDRYCLVPETRVLMGDGTYRPIGEVVEGDVVIGWSSRSGRRSLHRTRVVWAGRRKSEVVQLRLESGKMIRCTPDHHWLSSWSPHVKVPYRSTYRAAAYSSTGWVRGIKALQPLCAPPQGTNLNSVSYKLGYIRGLLDGDGHMRIQKDTYQCKSKWGKARRRREWRSGRPKKYQACVFSAERAHLERALTFANDIGLQTQGIKPRRGPAGWTLGFYSKAAYRRLSCSRGGSPPKPYKVGWLAGMYDAEGSRAVISQHRRVNPDHFELLVRWLEEFGFRVSEVNDKRHEDPVGVRILGGRSELLRFFDLTRPALTRKLDAAFRAAPSFREAAQPRDGIKTAFRLKRPLEVVSIQTETGNYIAEGYGSKNCDRKPGVYGGYDTRGSSNLDELKMRIQTAAHILPYADTHRHLPPKRRQSIYLAPEDQCRPSTGFSKQRKDARKRGASAMLEVSLAEAASRKRPAVVGFVEDHVGSGQKVVLFTGRRKDCEQLGKSIRSNAAIKRDGVDIWVAHGEQSQRARDEIVQEYMAHPGPCVLVGTGHAFGESLNIHDTDAAFFVMLPYSPGCLRQWEGRFARQGQKRPVTIYYVIAEGTVDEHMAAILIDKLPSVEKMVDDSELTEAAEPLAGIDPNESEEEFAASVLGDLDYG